MLRQHKNPVTNLIEMSAEHIDIGFKAEMAILGGCERLVVRMEDKETGKIVVNEYTGNEADLVFHMLAKPAMRLGEKLWK